MSPPAGEKGELCCFHSQLTMISTVYYSAVHQAYLPIVAASTRASTLHYCCNGGNDKEFAWGPLGHDHRNSNSFSAGKELKPQVLLIDAGCEWTCYAADITRTMPVGHGGKFTPEAKAIYELVLEMQKVLHRLLLCDTAQESTTGLHGNT